MTKPDLAPCPRCGAGSLDFEFRRELKDVAHMIVGGEWVSLEPFPVEIMCTACPYRKASTGREFTIDLANGVILFGRIDEE